MFKPGNKVRFVESYEGVYKNLKGKTLRVLWFHTSAESGYPEGRVKLEELKTVFPYHSINPKDLEIES